MDKKGKGCITIFVENFLSHSTEKFCRGTLPGFRKILVSKLFNKFEKCRQRLGLEPIPTASEPCCLTYCVMKTIGNSDKCQ